MEKTKSSLDTTPSEKYSSPETLIINKTTPQQTNPTEKPSPKYNISKKWIAIEAVLLVIIILLSLFYGLYKYSYKSKAPSTSQVKPTSTLSPTPSPDQITNWKTYTNPEIGISFKYPSDWNDPQESILSTKYLTTFSDGQEIEGQETKLEITSGIYFDQVLQRNLTLKELIDQTDYPESARPTQREIKLENQSGIHFIYHKHGLGYYMSNIFLAESDNSSDILNISYRHSPEESDPENPDPAILNQILSTFKFTDQETIDTSNWKTYTNDFFKFSIKYPNDLAANGYGNDYGYGGYIIFQRGDKEILMISLSDNFAKEGLGNYKDGKPMGKKTIGEYEWDYYNFYHIDKLFPELQYNVIAYETVRDELLYRIEIDNQIELTAEQNQILSTFNFTD